MQYIMRYFSGCILLLMVLIFSRCDFYPDGCDVCSFSSVVRGTVTNFDSTGYANTYVRVSAFVDSCNGDSTVLGGAAVQNSGSYKYFYHSLTGDDSSACYSASLIRVNSSAIPVVLDGPKEFDMPPLKAEEPYNEVQVNFIFPDLLQ